MGVVQVVTAGSDRNLQPTIARFVAVEKCAVRTGNLGTLRVRDGVTDIVRWGILGLERLHRAREFCPHRCQQRRFCRRIIGRRSLRLSRRRRNQENCETKSAQEGTRVTTDRNIQGLPHLQLDGSAKHPVYATVGNGTKYRNLTMIFCDNSSTAGEASELHTLRCKNRN